jgi:hypothetical protein
VTNWASIRPTPGASAIDHLDRFINKTESISNALRTTAAFQVCTPEALKTVHGSNGAKATVVKRSSTSLFAFEAWIASATSAQYSSRMNVAMCLNCTQATRSDIASGKGS